MTVHLLATTAAEKAQESQSTVNPWLFGIAAFAIFLLLLFVVTRLNIER